MNKSVTQKFRHELKYLITSAQCAVMRSRLEVLMKRDSHAENGIYSIRSLYFDDMHNTAYEDKLTGVNLRQKYRIRVYNCDDSVIRLERKLKCGSYICKESAPLTRAECDEILAGSYGFLLKKDDMLCRRFYVECMSKLLRPKVIVDYEREPFVCDAGDVRITLDLNVRAALLGFDLFDRELPSVSALDIGRHVMEVKFTEFLPSHIRRALPAGAADVSAVSKYTLCCERAGFRTPYYYTLSDDTLNMGGI